MTDGRSLSEGNDLTEGTDILFLLGERKGRLDVFLGPLVQTFP